MAAGSSLLDHFAMDPGHQRAGGVDGVLLTALGVGAHLWRHAVSAEDHRGAVRNLVQILHENHPAPLEIRHHSLVVHDLLAHVQRRDIGGEQFLHHLDGAVDARAEAAGTGDE